MHVSSPTYLTVCNVVDGRECNWCAEKKSVWASDDLQWRELSYPAIASASYFFASLYSAGIPMLFFGIMYSNRAHLRTQKFNKAYGFLTSKTSEKYYWWEVSVISTPVPHCSWLTTCVYIAQCAIIVRKLMLSLITKHSVDTTDGTSSIRTYHRTLCNTCFKDLLGNTQLTVGEQGRHFAMSRSCWWPARRMCMRGRLLTRVSPEVSLRVASHAVQLPLMKRATLMLSVWLHEQMPTSQRWRLCSRQC